LKSSAKERISDFGASYLYLMLSKIAKIVIATAETVSRATPGFTMSFTAPARRAPL